MTSVLYSVSPIVFSGKKITSTGVRQGNKCVDYKVGQSVLRRTHGRRLPFDETLAILRPALHGRGRGDLGVTMTMMRENKSSSLRSQASAVV